MIYGTAWKKDDTARLVELAIQSGFRAIDTACQPKHYNEKQVGTGIQNSIKNLDISRDDLFIQTKFTPVDGQDLNNIPVYQPHDDSNDILYLNIVKLSFLVSVPNNLKLFLVSNTHNQIIFCYLF